MLAEQAVGAAHHMRPLLQEILVGAPGFGPGQGRPRQARPGEPGVGQIANHVRVQTAAVGLEEGDLPAQGPLLIQPQHDDEGVLEHGPDQFTAPAAGLHRLDQVMRHLDGAQYSAPFKGGIELPRDQGHGLLFGGCLARFFVDGAALREQAR